MQSFNRSFPASPRDARPYRTSTPLDALDLDRLNRLSLRHHGGEETHGEETGGEEDDRQEDDRVREETRGETRDVGEEDDGDEEETGGEETDGCVFVARVRRAFVMRERRATARVT